MTGLPTPASAHPAFVHYPPQAAFGRPLPKNKLYAHSQASTRLKALFVQQVEQIVWQYKLAPETINLQARPGVPEIQVFGLQLKTPELHADVLRAIDRAVQFPIIFELSHAGRVQVVACHKQPGSSDSGNDSSNNRSNTSGPATSNDGSNDAARWVLGDYYATGWLAHNAPRSALPVALHLGGLYEQLLRALLPWPARPQETLAQQLERLGELAAKQRQAEQVAARLKQERQFNRKIVINGDLRRLQRELEALRR